MTLSLVIVASSWRVGLFQSGQSSRGRQTMRRAGLTCPGVPTPEVILRCGPAQHGAAVDHRRRVTGIQLFAAGKNRRLVAAEDEHVFAFCCSPPVFRRVQPI